jgi:AraC family transcriptional regulator
MSSLSLKFQRVTQTKVAYVQLIGPYENWGEGLVELKEWLQSQQAQIVGKPIGLFYDNPTETPPTKLRSDACLPIQGDLIPTGKFQIKDLPAGEIAVTRHLGPADEYTRTYGSFLEGLLKQGYMFYGPAREIFEEARPDLRPGMGIQIQQLVRKRD